MSHLTETKAPLVSKHLPKLTFPFILSNNVFPINVPNPKPDLVLINLFFDRMYGSPNTSKISSENPGPSSQIKISVILFG